MSRTRDPEIAYRALIGRFASLVQVMLFWKALGLTSAIPVRTAYPISTWNLLAWLHRTLYANRAQWDVQPAITRRPIVVLQWIDSVLPV